MCSSCWRTLACESRSSGGRRSSMPVARASFSRDARAWTSQRSRLCAPAGTLPLLPEPARDLASAAGRQRSALGLTWRGRAIVDTAAAGLSSLTPAPTMLMHARVHLSSGSRGARVPRRHGGRRSGHAPLLPARAPAHSGWPLARPLPGRAELVRGRGYSFRDPAARPEHLPRPSRRGGGPLGRRLPRAARPRHARARRRAALLSGAQGRLQGELRPDRPAADRPLDPRGGWDPDAGAGWPPLSAQRRARHISAVMVKWATRNSL